MTISSLTSFLKSDIATTMVFFSPLSISSVTRLPAALRSATSEGRTSSALASSTAGCFPDSQGDELRLSSFSAADVRNHFTNNCHCFIPSD